jgi:hypothetical protein
MMVSHSLAPASPPPASAAAAAAAAKGSALRVSRMILPEGVWIASFAGFDGDDDDDGAVPGLDDAMVDPDDDAADPLADPLAMLTKLIADVGRASGFGPPPETLPNGADAA